MRFTARDKGKPRQTCSSGSQVELHREQNGSSHPCEARSKKDASRSSRGLGKKRPNVRVTGLGEGYDNVDGSENPGQGDSEDITAEKRAALDAALRKNWLFQSVGDSALHACIDAMKKIDVKAGDDIVAQGDAGLHLYAVLRGSCNVIVDGNVMDHTISEGGTFGELALFYEAPRSATVRAKTDCEVWSLGSTTVRSVLRSQSQAMIRSTLQFLKGVPSFAKISEEPNGVTYLNQLAQAFTSVLFQRGDAIVTQGEQGRVFYIIKRGSARVIEDGVEKEHRLKAGDWFGEYALLSEGSSRTATIIADNEDADDTTMECLGLEQKDFLRLLGPYESFTKRGYQCRKQAVARSRRLKAFPFRRSTIAVFSASAALV